MADVKISQLPAATTPLAGTEEIPLVQSGVTKRATVDDIVGTISGVVTSVTGTAPVVSSGGTTPAISMAAASGSTNGYLTSTDWNTFNNKQPAGSYLTNGGALGTPSSGTATNLTGLPLTTGVTGLLPVANGGTGTASPSLVAGTNVTVSGTWPNQTINSTASGTGDVVGPASSTDNAVARFDGTTGKLIQNSSLQVNDSGEVTVGVWKGTEVGLSYGGTGASSASQARGNILPSYTGNAGKVLAVNSGATDVEYISAGGTGTVTSVAVSGGTTGLTTSGGPITAAGTITLAGTLAVANGGTGTSTPSLVAGTNVTISGTWPNQTINSSGGGSMTYPGAGIANSTGSAWDTSYSTTGSGTVVALATSPTFVTPVLGTPTSGDFSTGTFTWPTFNQNTTGTAAGLSSTLAIGSGGTGQTTAAAAITALTGTQTSAYYLRSNGTSASLSALSAADLTGTVAIASGGTGQTTASAAFNALSPVTTTGDLIIGNGVNSATRLGIGTNGYVLTSNGTTATWAASTGGVTSFSAGTTGLTPSTGTTGSITLAGTLSVANGGTGATSLTANNVILGNGTSAVQVVAPGTSGNVLTSNGTTWQSTAPAASGLTRAQVTAISLVYGF